MPRRKTHAEFVAEVEALVGDEYEVLGEYIDSHTKIAYSHKSCGHNYEAKPNSFLTGKRCPKCAGKTRKNTAIFKREVSDLSDGTYEVLGNYTNNYTGILVKHITCGQEYSVIPHSFLSGSRCPKCNGGMKKDTKIFKEEVWALVESEYKVLGEYVNTDTKIKIKHLTCGYKYNVTPKSFLNGTRCPNCKASKGEQGILKFLQLNNINNIREYKNNACRDKIILRFDFAVKQGNDVAALVEYDGIQHYESVSYFGGEKTFRATQRRDAIKTKFCADNGIPLIRIPYWDYDNIDAILTEKLLPLLYNEDKHNAS